MYYYGGGTHAMPRRFHLETLLAGTLADILIKAKHLMGENNGGT